MKWHALLYGKAQRIIYLEFWRIRSTTMWGEKNIRLDSYRPPIRYWTGVAGCTAWYSSAWHEASMLVLPSLQKWALQQQDGSRSRLPPPFSKRNQKTPLLLACVLHVWQLLPHGHARIARAIHFIRRWMLCEKTHWPWPFLLQRIWSLFLAWGPARLSFYYHGYHNTNSHTYVFPLP